MSIAPIVTSIPVGLGHPEILSVMHNHEIMIDVLAPENTARKLVEGDPVGDQPVKYLVTAPTPIGIKMTFPLTLTNRVDGFDSCVEPRPPTGQLKISAQWRLKGDKLQEDVEVEGNFVTKKVAKGNVEKSHPDQHMAIFQKASG